MEELKKPSNLYLRTPKEYHSSAMENESLVLRKINGGYHFDNFDESQHLNGCPIKWFYNKKLSEQNKFYRIQKRSSKQSLRSEENKKDKNKITRDRTPIDVKIREFFLEGGIKRAIRFPPLSAATPLHPIRSVQLLYF